MFVTLAFAQEGGTFGGDNMLVQLLPFLLIGIGLWFWNRRQRRKTAGQQVPHVQTVFAGTERGLNSYEINRLVLAYAYTGGPRFRRSVIARARNSLDAPAIETGVNMEGLLQLCFDLERKDTVYRGILAALVVSVLIGVSAFIASDDLIILVSTGVIAVGINGIRRALFYSEAYHNLSPGKFDVMKPLAKTALTNEDTSGLPPKEQNVVVYSSFVPFEFAGVSLGGWSVSIDASKPASNDVSARSEITSFTEDELWNVINDGFRETKIAVRSIIAIHGTDATLLPTGKKTFGVTQPRVCLDEQELNSLLSAMSKSMRRYLWISVNDWGGELAVSSFWRCALRDRILQVELSRFVLLPIASTNREIDNARGDWRYKFGQFLVGAMLAPLALIEGPLMLLADVQLAMSNSFGRDKQRKAEAIQRSPRYNYGAPKSMRVELMGTEFLHYFQKMDQQYYQKTVDKILLDTLINFLDDHGVDTTDLRDHQTAIFNTGVIVRGGDVTAQNLAVGTQARVETAILGRVRQRSETRMGGET
jgi:hypothetical protein